MTIRELRNMNPLELYAAAVRDRIETCNGLYFPNTSPERSVIVLREFLQKTQVEAKLFCGAFALDVYGPLGVDLVDAVRRGVRLQVITAMPVENQELAGRLKQVASESGGCVEFRLLNRPTQIGHFAIFDGLMFRQELEQETREAMVCACAAEGEPKARMEVLKKAYDYLWSESLPEEEEQPVAEDLPVAAEQ